VFGEPHDSFFLTDSGLTSRESTGGSDVRGAGRRNVATEIMPDPWRGGAGGLPGRNAPLVVAAESVANSLDWG
jgi:hypothetical protein